MADQSKSGLSMGLRLSYAGADLGFQMMIQLPNIYLLLFLTDLVGVPAALAGIIMTVANIIGAVSVPILGPAIERSNMKWGKYRSWILMAPIAVLLFETLLFTSFGPVSITAQVIISTICFACQALATNATYIAYTSLNSVLAVTSRDAVTLSTFRSQGGTIGKIVAGYILAPMIFFFGGTKDVMAKGGFFWTALITAAICMLCFHNLFRATKGKDVDTTGKEAVKVKDMLKMAVSNRPMMLMLVAETTRIITIFVVMALFPFFFIHVVQSPESTSTFFGSTYFIAFLSAFLIPLITRIIDQRTTYCLGMILFASAMLTMYFFSGNATVVIIIACVGYAGYAWGNTLNTSMLTNIADYNEYKTGFSCRAVVFSVYQISVKLAAILSSSISGFGLAMIGYQAGATLTPQVVTGLKNLSMLLPAGLLVISSVCIMLYGLQEKEMPKIREALTEQRATAAVADSGGAAL